MIEITYKIFCDCADNKKYAKIKNKRIMVKIKSNFK